MPVELLLPGNGDLLRHIDERLSRGERVEPLETVCIRKDGKHIVVESAISPIFGPSGAIIGSASTARDISDRKRAQALAAGQAQLLEFVAGGAALPDVLRAPGRVRGGARRGRARVDPPARSRRGASAPRRRTEPAGALLRGDRRHRDRPERRVVRHRRLPPRARMRLGHRERSALVRLPRRCARGGAREPAGRRRSSRPTARCSARSPSTTAKRATAAPTTSSWSSSRPTSPESRSSAPAPRTRPVPARSATAISSRTPTSRSPPSRWTRRSPR